MKSRTLRLARLIFALKSLILFSPALIVMLESREAYAECCQALVFDSIEEDRPLTDKQCSSHSLVGASGIARLANLTVYKMPSGTYVVSHDATGCTSGVKLGDVPRFGSKYFEELSDWAITIYPGEAEDGATVIASRKSIIITSIRE